MWELVLQKQKNKGIIIFKIITFCIIFLIYTYMDNFGYQNYKMLGSAFGYSRVFATIMLNILISMISAHSIGLAYSNYKLTGTQSSGSFLSTIGNLVGIYFTGCASCGISLLSSIGISFGSAFLTKISVTPGAIEFKLLALILVVLGLMWTVYNIKKSKCRI